MNTEERNFNPRDSDRHRSRTPSQSFAEIQGRRDLENIPNSSHPCSSQTIIGVDSVSIQEERIMNTEERNFNPRDSDRHRSRTPSQSFAEIQGRRDLENIPNSSYPCSSQTIIGVDSVSIQEEISTEETERELEEIIDKIKKDGVCNERDVLSFLSKMDEKKEKEAQILITCLLHRGADPSYINPDGDTALHIAVKKNFKSVCAKLLDYGANPNIRDQEKNLPFKLALDGGNDVIAAMLIRTMKNKTVRKLYISSAKDKTPEFSFHALLEKEEMSETVVAVLDSMIEPADKGGKVDVYYSVLETDENGQVPSFDSESKTGLQIIAQKGNKNIVNHDLVRLLVKRKWKKYARRRFLYNCIFNIITFVTITFSAIVASMAKDPTVYNITALQVTRGICEVWSLGMTIYTLVAEIMQIRRHRLEYFKIASNWVDIISCFLILLLPPLRFTHRNEEWFFFSAAYLFLIARMLKFATVFRKSGAYVLILWRIIKHDILQFTAFFVFILLAFSGCLLLSLRGEGSLEQFSESSSFWSILFVGIRILIESERILEYTEFQTISIIIMMGFLFTICIVLLNILIAQVSDTYQKVQQDAQREYEVNRASIVARGELNSPFFCMAYRNNHFKEADKIDNVGESLKKLEYLPTENLNRCIQEIYERLDSYKLDFRSVFVNLSRLETILSDMEDAYRGTEL